MLLLPSDCTLYTEVLAVFLVAKINTIKKMFMRNFLEFLVIKCYFIIFLDQ